MPTESEIDAFFAGLQPRRDELARRYRAGWPLSMAGCGIGCLLPIGLLLGFIGFGEAWKHHPLYTASIVTACVVAVIGLLIGLVLYQRGQRLFEPIDVAVDAELMAPFAAFLVPGATFERLPLENVVEWRPSLLFPRRAHAHQYPVARVTGRLAGLPVVIDELEVRYRNDTDARSFVGWVARFELPFTVGGHLRVLVPSLGYGSLMWNEGFETMSDAQARYGKPYEIDVAAPGVTPEGADEPTSDGVPAAALLTDPLFMRLHADSRMHLAAAGRTLWVTVPWNRVLDPRAGIALFGGHFGKKAFAHIADLEAVAREIARAGGGRL